MIGIELEYLFAPDTSVIRCIGRFLKSGLVTLDTLRTISREHLNREIKDFNILLRDIEEDGDCDELILRPLDYKFFIEEKEIFKILFKKVQDWGYTATSSLIPIGMHITIEVNRNLISDFIKFMYFNRDFYVKLSGRIGIPTKYVDIQYLLGDRYGLLSTDQIEKALENALSIVSRRNFKSLIGLRLNKNLLQITHFSSTLSYNELIIKIQFTQYIFKYFQESKDYSLKSFWKYLKNSKDRPEELLNFIENNGFLWE